MYEKNVRSELTTTDWQQLSRLIRYQAHGICSICGAENLDLRDMDAHEVWDYIIEKKNGEKEYIQRLREIVPVCKKCHATIHIGHTKALGKQTHEILAGAFVKYLEDKEIKSDLRFAQIYNNAKEKLLSSIQKFTQYPKQRDEIDINLDEIL